MNAPGDVYELRADADADRAMRSSYAHEATMHPPSVRGGNLDRSTQAFMESRFGADFSAVRVHADGAAARMSHELSAQAFTVGHDIYFGSGQYSPASDRGRHLLAHELAHTIQQGASKRIAPRRQATVGLVNIPEPREREKEEPESALAEESAAGELPPMIQRSTTWVGATVHESLNRAETAITGVAPVTLETLNGTKIESDADAEGAINAPPVITSGSGTAWTAKVASVPKQEGGDDETVLAKPPWTFVTTKAAVGAKFGVAACSGAGNTTLTAIGKPTDDDVYKANRRHEDHHVSDDKKAFEDTIGEWDKKVQGAKDKATEFKGASEAAATAALWTAMGNKPKEAGRSFHRSSLAKGGAYHGTPAGGPMSLSNPKSNATCTTSSIEVTNPS